MGEQGAVGEREATDEEMAAAIEEHRRGVADGSIPLCFTAEELREDIRERFGR